MPDTLAAEPEDTSTAPLIPAALEPEVSLAKPLGPLVEAPEDTKAPPLAPVEEAGEDCRITEPEASAPFPEDTVTLPPTPDDELLEPALTSTSPPSPEFE